MVREMTLAGTNGGSLLMVDLALILKKRFSAVVETNDPR